MKLLFSESAPDTVHYVYPYAVWAFLEPGETPADAFESGFLPSTPALDRFYLVRQVRVPLREWHPTSENRRVLRKGEGLTLQIVPRNEFEYSTARRESWLAFAEERFGTGVMPATRLDRLMSSPVVSHLLHFTETSTGRDRGTVLMYLEPPRVAFYYFAFYQTPTDLREPTGMVLMTRAVEHFAREGWAHLHMGGCYSDDALYKTQFEPVEFFNGFRWSRNLNELKHLVRTPATGPHRLETEAFRDFQSEPLAELARRSPFRIEPPGTPGGPAAPIRPH
jgi:hypothetical protein